MGNKSIWEQENRELRERIEELEKPPCEWTYDDHHDVYEGSCGVAWCMIEGSAEENGVKYCPGCGGAVEVRRALAEIGGEDE